MFIAKINKKDVNLNLINKYFVPSISSYIKRIFKNNEVNIIEDSKSLEFISSNKSNTEESATIELTFKKIITINNLNMDDRQYIDKIISEIKNFCDQTIIIDTYSYLPLNMRTPKDADNRTSPTGNRD